MNKFNIGDKVKIINYGSLLWIGRSADIEMEAFKDKEDLDPSNPHIKTIDMSPELVGQEGVVSSFTLTQGKCQYSLSGINGKSAWYSENQLELI